MPIDAEELKAALEERVSDLFELGIQVKFDRTHVGDLIAVSRH
jgi:hypothetical protein